MSSASSVYRANPAPAPGEPLIGALLRFPREEVVQRMLDAVNAAGYDLTRTELGILMYPGPEGKRPSELARACDMSRQSMNYLLAGLEARGYLHRTDGESGGARVVRTSAQARAAMELMRKTVKQIEREWAKVLGAERFAALRDTLLELSAALGKLPARGR